jgi:hypothetical protein
MAEERDEKKKDRTKKLHLAILNMLKRAAAPHHSFVSSTLTMWEWYNSN